MFELAGQTAMASGTATEIAEASAKRFCFAGANVVIADLNLEDAEAVEKRLELGTFAMRTDVSHPDSIERAVTEVPRRTHRIDILVNRAPNFLSLTALIAVIACGLQLAVAGVTKTPTVIRLQQSAPSRNVNQNLLLRSFAALDPIDAHVHIYKDDPSLDAFLKQYHLHVLDIAYVDDRYPFFAHLQPQLGDILQLVHSTAGRTSFCTALNPYPFEKPGFSGEAIRQLNRDFADGAVAVKIYKTVGMEIRKKDGKYLMPDDPIFGPVYKDIAAHNRTLLAHLAEPTSCWLAPNPENVDYGYYKKYPNEYCYLHRGWPRKAIILAARDHLLEQNPKLRVVGAHLGSMELDVNEIAKRFDLYPNLAVDTAARVPYLMLQPRAKIRAFLIKYQDRVIYATDFDPGDIEEAPPNLKASLNKLKNTYARDWMYFATDEILEYRGKEIKGLKLPPSVLRKLYHDNAVGWYPGILARSENYLSHSAIHKRASN